MIKTGVQHEKYVVKVRKRLEKILDNYSRHENAFTLEMGSTKRSPR